MQSWTSIFISVKQKESTWKLLNAVSVGQKLKRLLIALYIARIAINIFALSVFLNSRVNILNTVETIETIVGGLIAMVANNLIGQVEKYLPYFYLWFACLHL